MNSRLNDTEEHVSELRDRIEITQSEQQTKTNEKKKATYRIYGII